MDTISSDARADAVLTLRAELLLLVIMALVPLVVSSLMVLLLLLDDDDDAEEFRRILELAEDIGLSLIVLTMFLLMLPPRMSPPLL